MSSSLLRVAAENRLKISQHEQEQRRAPRNLNQPPTTLLASPNASHQITQAAQGSQHPDASQPLAAVKLRKATIAKYAVQNYNPPAPHSSLESSVDFSDYGSLAGTADTSLDCSDTESEDTMEENEAQNGVPAAASHLNPEELNDLLTAVGAGLNSMPAAETSPASHSQTPAHVSEEQEEENRRVEAYYEAVSRNLPRGTIYVAYLRRLPADWQRPLYQCEDLDCAFHNFVNTEKTVSTCRVRTILGVMLTESTVQIRPGEGV